MSRFEFWRKWLLTVCVGISVLGLGLVLAPSWVIDAAFEPGINTVFWPGGEVPVEAQVFQRWVYAVLGATVFGWGVSLAVVVHFGLRARSRWAWNCVFWGIVCWYIPDSLLSAYYGVWFNVALNTVLLILVLTPLWMTRASIAQSTQHP